MTKAGQNAIHVLHKGLGDLAQGPVGKYSTTLVLDDDRVPFAVLDTPDQILRRSGRVLVDAGGALELLGPEAERVVQPATRGGDLVADLVDGAVRQALQDLPPGSSLRPVGSGLMRRGTLVLLNAKGKARCRADLRVLCGAGDRPAMAMLVAALGDAKPFARLRKYLMAHDAKAVRQSRLYTELSAAALGAQPAPQAAIGPGVSAFDAATDLIAGQIAHLRAQEAGILADRDAEFLHDYRIGLRKIRLVLCLFKEVYGADQTSALKAGFAALMEPTGPLRDLDVQLQERRPLQDLLPKALHSGLDLIFARFAEERRQEQAAFARHLASPAYHRQIADLASRFDRRGGLAPGPNADRLAQTFARRLIWKRYCKVRGMAGQIDLESRDTALHLLRIHCKKLRYLMEFFRACLPAKDFEPLLKALKNLQDGLGAQNDHAVQRARLRAFLQGQAGATDSASRAAAQSATALSEVLHRKQLEERPAVLKSFARFSSTATRERFRSLVQSRKSES